MKIVFLLSDYIQYEGHCWQIKTTHNQKVEQEFTFNKTSDSMCRLCQINELIDT